ncbi:cytochrome P450 [Xylaria cf. heliscus]|nr:cytochrome P450 [Xylaria cf. heliscus]
MLLLTSPVSLVVIALLGILCHRIHFIRGEHHRNARFYFSLWIIVSTLVFALASFANAFNRNHGVYVNPWYFLSIINASFLGAMFTSIAMYRLFEHPLREFSGPPLAAVSKFWHLFHILRKSNHLFLDDLYHRYGAIVRTGPQELTVFNPAIWQHISGLGTSCIKGPWYDQLWPVISISSIRTKGGYGRRRKRWDDALSSVTGKEMHHIHSIGETSIDITTWFRNLSFDVMGDLAFGKSFSFTENPASIQQQHATTLLIAQGLSMLRLFTPIPWITGICVALAHVLPFAAQKWSRTLKWAAETCDMKISKSANLQNNHAVEQTGEDIFTHFIRTAFRDGDLDSLDRLSLHGDALVITVAGSDTTAGVLTMLFYELARRTDIQEHLRKELVAAGLTPEVTRNKGLQKGQSYTSLLNIPYLDACINESMRLYPPLPTGGIRQTVDKGFQLGKDWIPPNTIIVAPRWSIGRLESAFVQASEFIPERWTARSSMVKEPQAFNPFGIGRHLCPGKQLGMTEVRIVAAMIVANFTFTLSPTEDRKTRVVEDFMDSFTAAPGKLELVFTPVSGTLPPIK